MKKTNLLMSTVASIALVAVASPAMACDATAKSAMLATVLISRFFFFT